MSDSATSHSGDDDAIDEELPDYRNASKETILIVRYPYECQSSCYNINTQALRETQLEYQDLRNAFRKLQLEKNAMDAIQPRRKKQASKDMPEELAPHVERIALLGRRYGTMVVPWVDPAHFQIPRPNLDAYSEERYHSAESKKQGLVAELYDFIPEIFHDPMNKHTYFATTVSS